ncbi:glycosyltransferase family 2 protein [Vibrio parahaemolyticus]
MLVSIITPTYNSEKFLQDTFDCIKNQTHHQWEWLVTDDCSSDDSYRLLEQFAKEDSRVRISRNNVNSGASVTRNKSISRANGSYIAFLDSDDLWDKNKLKTQLEFMKLNDISFCFTSYEVINEEGEKLGKIIDSRPLNFVTYHDMLRKKATLGCSTVMLKNNGCDKIIMPDLRTGQDYALWLKLLRNGNKAFHLNEILTLYRITSNSISRNKFKKAIRQWEIYREIERLPLFSALVNFYFYAYRAVFRR